jgi:predicted HTH domain antitoxin
MKLIRVQAQLYKKAEKASRDQGVELDVVITQALKQGLDALSEKNILDLYRQRSISLQKAAEMLSVDIWEMIEKIRQADIHMDYTAEELAEDLA